MTMRFLLVHRLDERVPGAFAPSPETMAEMGKFMEEAAKSGVLLAAEGVRPSADGARVRFAGGKRTVTDGPFAEAKEVIAGFALVDVRSKEEAVYWASRFGELLGDVEVEVRQISEPPS
jgi:hypothetical protein